MEDLKTIIKHWLERNDLGVFEPTISFYLAAFTLFVTGVTFFYKAGSYIFTKIEINRAEHNAIFFSKKDIRDSLKNYVPTKFQNISPAVSYEPGNTDAWVSRNPLIPFLLNKVYSTQYLEQKHYLVLADSGMGKTTFIINLFYSYSKKKVFLKKKFLQLLLPLGEPDAILEIQKVKDPENTILLLDAFDEDSEAVINHETQLDKIINLTKRFHAVLITCRTQFFATEEDEPNKIRLFKHGGQKGQFEFVKLYVSPFDTRDINIYLKKRYPFYRISRRKAAKRVVEKSPSLMVRPMLLNYIEDIMDDSLFYGRTNPDSFKLNTASVDAEGSFKFTHEIYGLLIEKWINRESSRNHRQSFAKELYRFSQEIAVNMYENREERRGYFIDSESIQVFSSANKFELSLLELKSRSLLNRNSEAKWKFSHRSIHEYFLARHALVSFSFLREFNFDGMDNVRLFLREMIYKNYLPEFLEKHPSFEFDFFSRKKGFGKMGFGKASLESFKDIILISFDYKYLDYYKIRFLLYLFPLLNVLNSQVPFNPSEVSAEYKKFRFDLGESEEELLVPKLDKSLAVGNKEMREKLKSLEFQFKKFERFERRLKKLIRS
ncbi:hypothetical protein HQN86_25125 [Pedobacter panaciterrae]|uniref:NACHT domain-containing protein n=1 Tax=Pedobacter panaciterrae TaxID=363849 RepID=UPI00155DBFE2|nr:hypothetical protein [Pedobacter panaciterrae]NQX56925.1 hypothetical protein [Pedobacter panaciterrae]